MLYGHTEGKWADSPYSGVFSGERVSAPPSDCSNPGMGAGTGVSTDGVFSFSSSLLTESNIPVTTVSAIQETTQSMYDVIAGGSKSDTNGLTVAGLSVQLTSNGIPLNVTLALTNSQLGISVQNEVFSCGGDIDCSGIAVNQLARTIVITSAVLPSTQGDITLNGTIYNPTPK